MAKKRKASERATVMARTALGIMSADYKDLGGPAITVGHQVGAVRLLSAAFDEIEQLTREDERANPIDAQVRYFIHDIANNYDCDQDAHKYGTRCRRCCAKELLATLPAEQPVGKDGA